MEIKEVVVVINWVEAETRVFSKLKLAIDYVKFLKLNYFGDGQWAKAQEDIEQGNCYTVDVKKIHFSSSPKNT